MSIGVVPVLDEILFELIPHIYVRGGRYWSSHNPIFYTAFPLSNGGPLYKGEGMCNFSVGVGHNWGVRIEELVEFEFVHELVGFCSVAREDGGFFAF